MASLLIHVNVEFIKETDEEYLSIAELRKRMCRQKVEHEDLVKRKLVQQVRWS
jgi:hypothetical protein